MKRTNRFHLSFFSIFGIAIIITGIFLMWCAYNGTGQKKLGISETAEEDEDIEEIEAYYASIKTRSDTAFRISLAVFGGLCIMGGIPVFYVSHADTIHKLPKRKKYSEKQETDEEEFDEFEFDYDNFDFDEYCYIERDDAADGIRSDKFKSSEFKSNEFKTYGSVMDIIKKNYKKDDKK